MTLVRPFLALLQTNYLDFHGSFRLLCTFRPSQAFDEIKVNAFIDKILGFSSRPEMIVQDSARKGWREWLEKYAERVKKERHVWITEPPKANGANGHVNGISEDGNKWEETRMRDMRGKNPRFVLRQWVLEEVIKKVENDNKEGRKVLAKVMHVRFSLGRDVRRNCY